MMACPCASAERDQRIRSWLRNQGYEVIEIAVSDLYDAGAMVRHFRKLAGYLGARDLREALRADTSWFGDAGKAMATPQLPFRRVENPGPGERYVTCVPLLSLRVAAGEFAESGRVAGNRSMNPTCRAGADPVEMRRWYDNESSVPMSGVPAIG